MGEDELDEELGVGREGRLGVLGVGGLRDLEPSVDAGPFGERRRITDSEIRRIKNRD